MCILDLSRTLSLRAAVDIRESKKLCHPLHKNGQIPDDVRRQRFSRASYEEKVVCVVETTGDEI